MPSAITTKTKPGGAAIAKGSVSKWKDYPVREKDSSSRDSKKARTTKTADDARPARRASKETKRVQIDSPSTDSDSSDSGGGVALRSDTEDNVTPADGLHPDRLKAVITSSRYFPSMFLRVG